MAAYSALSPTEAGMCLATSLCRPAHEGAVSAVRPLRDIVWFSDFSV
jgi:hypothetical protein